MNRRTTIHSLAALACAGLMGCLFSAQSGFAKTWRLAPAPAVRDIALQSNNTLHGQVVDSEGMAQANFEVWISREDGPTRKTRTDARGRFTASDLTSGIYRVETVAGGDLFRLWAPKSAPSDAQSNVLLVVATRVSGG
jgi:hypothetical protein